MNKENNKFNNFIKNIMPSLVCILIGLIIGFIVIIIVNAEHSGQAILNILLGGFNAPIWQKGVGAVIVNSIPLILCSLSIIFAYKCGLFNIGAPGQYVIGIMFGFLGAYVLKLPWYLCLILCIIGGALWGCIPGLFKAYLNVNEVITSIMFNWIGLHLMNYVSGPEAGLMYNLNLSECYELPESALIPSFGATTLFGGYKYVTYALFIAIVVAFLVKFVLEKTKFGYEIKATGFNKDAAKYAGIAYKRNIIITMAIAGAIAGLAAGCYYLAGKEIYSATKQTSLPAMGFNGIASAFLGCLDPIGAIFSSIFITHITVGGGYLDTTYYTSEIGSLISSLIIYLCAFNLVIRTILDKVSEAKRKKKELQKVKEGK